jgi:hypothetical protein
LAAAFLGASFLMEALTGAAFGKTLAGFATGFFTGLEIVFLGAGAAFFGAGFLGACFLATTFLSATFLGAGFLETTLAGVFLALDFAGAFAKGFALTMGFFLPTNGF